MVELKRDNPNRSEIWYANKHNKSFIVWLKQYILEKLTADFDSVSEKLKWLVEIEKSGMPDDDVFGKALGNPEHPGRVKKARSTEDVGVRAEIATLKEELSRQWDMIVALLKDKERQEAKFHISPSGKGSYNVMQPIKNLPEDLNYPVPIPIEDVGIVGEFSVKDPYNYLANWSNSSSICNWVGVTCDAYHERVIALNLGEMGLKGTLPSKIGNLSFLVELDLHSNNLYGELPKELIQLHKLQILNLSYNEFKGEIPTWIGSLSMLQHFHLCNNSFGGVIPKSISNLSKLETLNWNDNFIEGFIPFEIGKFQCLKILRIAVNKLSGKIPPTISNLSSLELLSLSHNFLTGDIPIEIGLLQNLKILYLGANKLSGHIPSNIFNISELQEIDLSWNNLSGSIHSNMCHGLPNLQMLHLQDNELSGALPSNWIQCKELKDLQLEYNSLIGDIPEGIGKLDMLQELYLNHNNLQGHIPKDIGNLTKLQLLYLNYNNLEGHIPKDIGNLTKLQLLYLNDNNLKGMVYPTNHSIVMFVLSASKLQEISLISHLSCVFTTYVGNILNR
ncbi:LRR receptor-like serine/threonine-protein kinase GSO1 [Prosopis cineraria]|uniref:LRR receptor-like serine/threonine-protein kinase GSO1 n=1 Tax=Prosopis cineraria TaxID=364024 RepID=UPI0024108356|nr:LRR receptor-like serine/threonine-protein kinase GSO1 [Prosopis cineraria]